MECTVTAALSSGRNAVFNINNVPVQRNYRTNIYGNLLTSKTDYQISVDAGFENDIVVDAELKALADKGGEIVLAKDINAGNPDRVLESQATPLTVTADHAVLDLNGHTINGDYIAVEGHLTVKNSGTVNAPGYVKPSPFQGNVSYVGSDGLPLFVVKEGGQLDFENVNITATKANGNSQEIIKVEEGGTLSIVNSTITSPRRGTQNEVLSVDEGASKVVIENSHLSSSATVFMTNYKGGDSYITPRITIKGSTFSPSDYNTPMPVAIIDIPCRLDVTGSTFEGSMNALTIRQGTATLKDCTLISNLISMSDYDINIYESYGAWEATLVRRQAALIVGNYVEPNISYFPDTNLSDPVRVTLSGTTTVKCNNPSTRNAIVVRAKDSSSSAVTLDVANTCTVTGLVKFLGGQINATGISPSE